MAEEHHRFAEPETSMQHLQARSFRALPYDADLQPGDSGAQQRRGLQQVLDALAGVEPRDAQHRRTTGIARTRNGDEALSPFREVDRLWHDGDLRVGDAVEGARDARGVPARHDDTIRTLGITPFPPRLDAEEHAHDPALVLQLVGDDALQRDHERARAAAPPSRPEE